MTEIKTNMQKITPEIARDFLTKNTKNRKLNENTALRYATDMREGNWETTHQGISFYEDGSLADGQHRLSAIVLSGITVEMLVTTGLPKVTVYAIDGHRIRNDFDKLKIEGTVDWASNKMVSSAKRMIPNKQYQKLTTAQLARLMPAIRFAIEPATVALNTTTGATASVIAAFALAIYYTDKEREIVRLASVFSLKERAETDAEFNMQRLHTALQNPIYKHGMQSIRDKMLGMTQQAIFNTLNDTPVKRMTNPKLLPYPLLDINNFK